LSMTAMVRPFPFSAIVGQEQLKRALLLGVIQPRLGGVLIRGTKGVAKSTAVRALAGLLPPLEMIAGCPFQRRPGETIDAWPLPPNAPTISRPAPLVELPLGATEDRVLGSLDLEKALRGQRAFEPGLLAAANRGILYIDEVNLLPDHLVDILLDASASGVHRLEREGLSLTHPAQFLLVGTMNPEEGDLRPQLLDRFGLAVDVADLVDSMERAEAVRRRLAFGAEPERFATEWQTAAAEIAGRIERARRLLPEVRVPEPLLHAVSERCLAAGVEGLRADLTVCMAACAWAAYQGRTAVEANDVDAVAELALAHRRKQPPDPPPPSGGRRPQNGEREAHPPVKKNGMSEQAPAADASKASLTRDDIGGLFTAPLQPTVDSTNSDLSGRQRDGAGTSRGPIARPTDKRATRSIAWAATLQSTGLRLGGTKCADRLHVEADDLCFWRRREPAGCLLLFVVDTSGSMAAWRRMRQTKAGIMALLLQAYQRRDRVALLSFRGTGVELILSPSRGLAKARQALVELPTGGATPLAQGLAAAQQFIVRHKRRQPRLPIWTVIFTDGRTNVPLRTSDPWQDALIQAHALGACASSCVVVDTETGWPRFSKARELAAALTARCVRLEDLLGRPRASGRVRPDCAKAS
jgi:magnesium chelatase subunit D